MTVTIEQLRHEGIRTSLPSFSSGQTVKVHYRVKEGEKERVQIFEGLIIAVNGGTSLACTITVRKMSGNIGVEQGFLVNSPSIVKIELIKEGKVRRSKIYYMRERQGKSARLKEQFYGDATRNSMENTEKQEAAALQLAEEEALRASEEKKNASTPESEETTTPEVEGE
ncbi:MAG: 50S ribosomal protein L19 [Candidatus Peregrinibacteria bacterium]